MKQKIVCNATVDQPGCKLKITSVYLTNEGLKAFSQVIYPQQKSPAEFAATVIWNETLRAEIEIDVDYMMPVKTFDESEKRAELTDPQATCLYSTNDAPADDNFFDFLPKNFFRGPLTQQEILERDLQLARDDVAFKQKQLDEAVARLLTLEDRYQQGTSRNRSSAVIDEKQSNNHAATSMFRNSNSASANLGLFNENRTTANLPGTGHCGYSITSLVNVKTSDGETVEIPVERPMKQYNP
jgi:hypothetical protein